MTQVEPRPKEHLEIDEIKIDPDEDNSGSELELENDEDSSPPKEFAKPSKTQSVMSQKSRQTQSQQNWTPSRYEEMLSQKPTFEYYS